MQTWTPQLLMMQQRQGTGEKHPSPVSVDNKHYEREQRSNGTVKEKCNESKEGVIFQPLLYLISVLYINLTRRDINASIRNTMFKQLGVSYPHIAARDPTHD